MTHDAERIWDVLLEDALNNTPKPDLNRRGPALHAPLPSATPVAAPQGRRWPRRLRLVAEGAVVASALLLIAWVLVGREEERRDGAPPVPKNFVAAPDARFEQKEGYVIPLEGWFVLSSGAPEVRAEGCTIRGVSGLVVFKTGAAPSAAEWQARMDWLRQLKLETEMLNKAKNWVVAGVIALAVLQGSAAVNGEEVKAPEEAGGTPAVVTSISEIEALPPGTKAVIGRNLRDSHLDFLSRVKSIEALTLEQCPDVTDAGAGYIAQLEALDTLDIWWCQKLTGSGLAKLCALPKLAHLTVNVRVALDARRDMNSQDGKAVAEKLNKLASLELRQGSHFPNDGMVHAIVAWLTNITSLSLADNDKLTDTSLKHVATLKRLSKLDLTSGSGFTDAGIAYLRDCAALETLDLSMLDSGMSQDGEGQSIIAQVVKLPHLKELILDGWELRFGRDKLKPLTTGSRLQRLKCGAGHGDESLAQLGKITSLRELDLSGSRVIIGSDEVAGALSGWSALTELRVLDLSGIEWYAGAMVRALPVLPKLEVLRVRNAYATDHGTIDEAALERIATITTLRELDLRQFYLGKEFKPEHFLKLKTLGNLRVMRLSRDVGRNDAERARFNEVMSELGKALPQCRFELEKDE